MSFIQIYRNIAATTPFNDKLTDNITDNMTEDQICDTVRNNGSGEFVEGICSGICDSAKFILNSSL